MAGEPTLRFGHINVNGWVAHLQETLAGVGFDPGPIDGMFFERTHAAVLGFQESRALVVDGVVGQQTWGALNAAAPAVPPASTPPAGGGGSPVGSGARFLQGPDFDEPSGGIFYVAENAGPTARAAFSVHDTITVSGPTVPSSSSRTSSTGTSSPQGAATATRASRSTTTSPAPIRCS